MLISGATLASAGLWLAGKVFGARDAVGRFANWNGAGAVVIASAAVAGVVAVIWWQASSTRATAIARDAHWTRTISDERNAVLTAQMERDRMAAEAAARVRAQLAEQFERERARAIAAEAELARLQMQGQDPIIPRDMVRTFR